VTQTVQVVRSVRIKHSVCCWIGKTQLKILAIAMP